MTQDQTQKKKMSIDDATPEEWDKVKLNTMMTQYQKNGTSIADAWNKAEEWEGPNDHPVFGKPVDMVESPPHYNNGSIECIEAIEAMLSRDEYIGYLRGNALKYMWRFRYKSKPFEDLRKARWYEERLMKFLLDNQDAV